MARPANSSLDDDRMRERLAQGALTLFREGGPEAVSLRKLAQHLGVSHTMLYRYFDSKEALFTAVRLASLRLLHDCLLAADDATAASVERIRALAQALIGFGRTYSREYRFLFSTEQPRLDRQADLLKLRHRVFDHIVDIARVARDKGVIAMDPRSWVHMAWALLHGLLMLNESDQLQEGRTFDGLVDEAVELLLGRQASGVRST